MNDLDEFHFRAYKSSSLYKQKMKSYHDKKIEKKVFQLVI